MPSLCGSCKHRRPPDEQAIANLRLSAGSAKAQEALQRQLVELQQHQRLEEIAVNERKPVRLERRPVDHDWCAKQSEPLDGTYHFCDWLNERELCEHHQCSEPGCAYCETGHGACVKTNGNGGPATAANELETKGTTTPHGDSPAAGWSLTLGHAYGLLPVARQVHKSLGGSSFQIDYDLEPFGFDPVVTDAGLRQTYLIFGGPGAGKTHYFKYLLSTLLAHDSQPGCLLLDPKGVLTDWLADALRKAGRPDDLVVLSAGARSQAFNVLGDDLAPKETGRLLTEVVLAGAAGVDEGWQVLIGDLLESAAIVISDDLSRPRDGGPQRRLTVAELLQDILYRRVYKYRSKDGVKVRHEYPIEVRARRVARTSTDVDAVIAADRIADFFTSTEDRQRRFVRQIIERSLAELISPDWGYLSGQEGGDAFYSSIIHDHRVVAVAVGQASPAFQRSLSTLVKALFQQAVLANLSRNGPPDGFFVLACDEYAQAITEGDTGLVSDSRFFSLSREAGCLSLLALQSVATGRSRFPASMRDRWEGILGNVTVKVFMRLNDVETAELGSSLAGTQHSFVPVVSTGLSGTGASMNEAVTMLEHPRVPPWYLTNRMRQGLALVHGTLDGRSEPVCCFVSRDEL